MPDKARHIRGYLRSTDSVTALLDELRRRDDLLQQVRRIIPEAIRSHCKQASLRDGLLVVSVDSPAWVARLKFFAPQLVDELLRLGVAIDDCRVRALPEPVLSSPATARTADTFSAATAARHVTDAATAISDPALQESLRRLAQSLASRTKPD